MPLSPALARTALTGTVALSLVVLFSPGSTVPSAPSNTDKVIHLVLFALLALTLRGVGLGARATLAVLVGYAVVSEVLQAVLPIRRDGGWADGLTDVLGALAGLLLVAGLTRARARAPRAAAPSGAPGTAGPTHR